MVSRGSNVSSSNLKFIRLMKDTTAGTNNFADVGGLHPQGRWSNPSSIVVILVSLHGAAAWRGGQRRTCEATINTSPANTQDGKIASGRLLTTLSLDYEKVTVLIDATAAARPDIWQVSEI